ncbi:hypothetical protein D3C80_1906140 [compost metagenome]
MHFEMPTGTPLAMAHHGNGDQDNEDGRQHGRGPGQETGILDKKLHGFSLACKGRSTASVNGPSIPARPGGDQPQALAAGPGRDSNARMPGR